MEREEYLQNMETILFSFGVLDAALSSISDEDLDVMRQTIARADAIGWVVDPSMWRDAQEDDRLKVQNEAIGLVKQIRQTMAAWKEAAEGREREPAW